MKAVWGKDLEDLEPGFPAQWLVRAALHRHQQRLISPKVTIVREGAARKVTIHVGCAGGQCKAPTMQLQLMEKNGTATWAACNARSKEPHLPACRGQL